MIGTLESAQGDIWDTIVQGHRKGVKLIILCQIKF